MSAYPPVYIQQIGPTPPIASLIPHTIIVVNADDTHGAGGTNQSLADANDYCTRRGIPTAGTYNASNVSPAIRQIHFGTVENECVLTGLQNATNPGYVTGTQTISTAAMYGTTPSGSSLLQLCYDEIVSNNCLCVIFSTYTPTRLLTTDGLATFCVQAVAAAAQVTLSLGSLTNRGIAGPGLIYAATASELAANIIPSNWASLTSLRPHGRLGCPDLTEVGSTFAELPLAAGNSSVYMNAVTNSLPRELTNNYGLPVHYSSTEENSACVGSATAYAAYIAAQGFTNATDMRSQSVSTDLAYKFLYTNPMSPQQTLWCALWLENLNFDAKGNNYGTPAYNDAGTGAGQLAFQNNYSLAAGAFGGCWFSFSYNWGMNMLFNGASTMVMTVGEPYKDNIAFGSEIFHMLVNQRAPLALANFYAPTPAAAVLGGSAFGDPLYAPFTSGFPPSYGATRGLIGGLEIGVS